MGGVGFGMDPASMTARERAQSTRANASGARPVFFVQGLWLLPSSWDRWAELFEQNGYVALTPGRPDDPETVVEANAHPETAAVAAFLLSDRPSSVNRQALNVDGGQSAA